MKQLKSGSISAEGKYPVYSYKIYEMVHKIKKHIAKMSWLT